MHENCCHGCNLLDSSVMQTVAGAQQQFYQFAKIQSACLFPLKMPSLKNPDPGSLCKKWGVRVRHVDCNHFLAKKTFFATTRVVPFFSGNSKGGSKNISNWLQLIILNPQQKRGEPQLPMHGRSQGGALPSRWEGRRCADHWSAIYQRLLLLWLRDVHHMFTIWYGPCFHQMFTICFSALSL